MYNIDLAIKFGSNEIIIYRKGFGVIAKEPAYLAVSESGSKVKVRAYGKNAEKMFQTRPNQIEVYRPIMNSEVINEKMATILMSEILKNVIQDKFLLTSIRALVAVPCALNEEQLLSLKKVLQESGINKVTFVQNSVCAHANLELDSHSHIMVVDIGKYITDISVLNEYSFDFGRMYFIGGHDMDKSIETFIADNHNLKLTDTACETIKNEVASLYDRDTYKTEYTGLDESNKLVKYEISANEVRVAISNVYDEIFKLIKDILSKLDKDVLSEIYNNGIMFVGGASEIPGLYEYAKKALDIPVIIPESPVDCVILGAGKLISSEREYIKINL